MFPAFQANVAYYLVSLTAKLTGENLDLDKIWQQQDLSYQLKDQLKVWASEVNDILHSSSAGRMISEWAKKPECWRIVQGHSYSTISKGIPEIK
jgi:uncharacterized protein Usg